MLLLLSLLLKTQETPKIIRTISIKLIRKPKHAGVEPTRSKPLADLVAHKHFRWGRANNCPPAQIFCRRAAAKERRD